MAATPLLGLELPVTGTLSGTWGDTVNNAITSLIDTAIAGVYTMGAGTGDVTLTTTTGAANQARSAILLCTGSRAALTTITAPASSKIYVIINTTTGGFGIKLVGAGPTTGITILNGEEAVVAWSGSDFVRIATNGGPIVGSTGTFTGLVSIAGGAQTASVTATQAAGAITLDCNLSNVFATTLTASITTPTYSNPHDGQTINWFITQGGAGSFTVAWGGVTAVKWPGGTAGVLSTAVGAVDLVVLTYRSSTGFWYGTIAKAFA
jgi:hypothetical protein